MSTPFHVQARLIERRGPVIVRDEARRVDAESRDEAFRIAQVWSSDRFTVWIWAVDAQTVPATWDLVERLDQPRHARGRPGTGGAVGRVRAGTACSPTRRPAIGRQ